MKYLRNHERSALFYEHNNVSQTLILAEHAAFEIYKSVVLFCVYYSNAADKYKRCWIGLYKSRPEASDNSTYWLDGNNSTYRNWHRDEPNSVDQCVYISNGEFYDGACSWSHRYICKGICDPILPLLVITSNFCLITPIFAFIVPFLPPSRNCRPGAVCPLCPSLATG